LWGARDHGGRGSLPPPLCAGTQPLPAGLRSQLHRPLRSTLETTGVQLAAMSQTARPQACFLLQTILGVGKLVSLVLLFEIGRHSLIPVYGCSQAFFAPKPFTPLPRQRPGQRLRTGRPSRAHRQTLDMLGVGCARSRRHRHGAASMQSSRAKLAGSGMPPAGCPPAASAPPVCPHEVRAVSSSAWSTIRSVGIAPNHVKSLSKKPRPVKAGTPSVKPWTPAQPARCNRSRRRRWAIRFTDALLLQ
jgi:hypothetical protein